MSSTTAAAAGVQAKPHGLARFAAQAGWGCKENARPAAQRGIHKMHRNYLD